MIMHSNAIPAWNGAGVLPPIRSSSGTDPDRSPYLVDLVALVDRFATTSERMTILHGFLRFRADLHEAGIVKGFQWLDGSYLEQVETLERRPPRDMDIVNFLDLTGIDQQVLVQRYGSLFDQKKVKANYLMDAYFVQIGGILDADTIRRVSYWYSMWSHRRDGLWKGFVQVDLDPVRDADAGALLNLQGGIHHA